MKKLLIIAALISNTTLHGNITVTSAGVTLSSFQNQNYLLDLDNDGVNDYMIYAHQGLVEGIELHRTLIFLIF